MRSKLTPKAILYNMPTPILHLGLTQYTRKRKSTLMNDRMNERTTQTYGYCKDDDNNDIFWETVSMTTDAV